MTRADYTTADAPPSGERGPAFRRWSLWLLLGPLRALARLPWRRQLALGRALGRVAGRLARRRRRIAARNLELCFPELSAGERGALLDAHFEALGIGLVEAGMAWRASDERIAALGAVDGIERLRAAGGGRGVMLVGGHFTTLEMTCRLLGIAVDFDVTYRPLGMPAVDRLIRRGRSRGAARLIPKSNFRGMLASLRDGRTVWMAVDQAHTGDNRAAAPFFGIPAPTTTSPSRIAAGAAAVLPLACRRLPDGRYRLTLGPALEGFPSGDPLADATRLNRIIEEQVREAPEQYYWIHRRFKGESSPYDDDRQ